VSLNRYAVRRDKTEQIIVDALRKAGATVTQISGAGVGDLLVGFRGNNFLIECKTKRGTLTEAQKQFRERWQGQYAVCRTDIQALEAIGAI
jgi:mevalonate kinase